MTLPYPTMPAAFIERYLDLLGVQKRTPSIDALHEIVQAHLARIPFENISKLYYKKHRRLRGLPGLELFLDGAGRFHFGGTCYANNYYLYQLIANLGYQIKLCGADMSNLDVHLVSVVNVEHREYLVDAGYAAPFITPLPRDLATDYTITLGRDRYVLRPQDAHGRSHLDLYRDGILKHGYSVNPVPREIQEFEHIIAASYREEATFMNALLLARFSPDRSIVIHNLTVIETQGAAASIRTLDCVDQLGQVVYEHFAIPEEFTAEIVGELDQLKDAWT